MDRVREDDGGVPSNARAPRLGERGLAAMRLRHLSLRTQEAYLGWMRRFHEFNGRRDPARLGAEQVTAFLNMLATEGQVAAATQNQALAALLFLYRAVPGIELPWLDDLVRAKRLEHLPVVLTRAEVIAVLGRFDGQPRLMATLLYGCVLTVGRWRNRFIEAGIEGITKLQNKVALEQRLQHAHAIIEIQ